jgi:hypothetical protein
VRGAALALALALLGVPAAAQVGPAAPAVEEAGEQVLAGLSQTSVALTVGFEGLELLVFGAVWRAAPIPPRPSRCR